MDVSASRRRADTALEYALFTAIITMTVSGTFLYNAIVYDPHLSSFTTHLIAAYLLFLALAFGQLNVLHRKRARLGTLDRTESLAERRPTGSVMRKQELEQERGYS